MICQLCGKETATTHFKKTINGKTEEYFLCAACAAKKGLGSFWNDWSGLGMGLEDFWGSLFAEPNRQVEKDTVRCEGCGHTFSEIARDGRVGCPKCYATFYDRLLPSIQRIHGRATHAGKTATVAGATAQREQELDALRKQLAECLARQEYERCAELRDRIKELEDESHE